MKAASTVYIALTQALESCSEGFRWGEQQTACLQSPWMHLLKTYAWSPSRIPRAGTQDTAFNQGSWWWLAALMFGEPLGMKTCASARAWVQGSQSASPYPSGLCMTPLSQRILASSSHFMWPERWFPTHQPSLPPLNTCFLAHTIQFHWGECTPP